MSEEKKNIEIEHRARFEEGKYNELQKFLGASAEDLGQDDKDVYFFLFPDKLVKTVNNVSKKTAKIVLKLNKIGKGSDFEEIEIPIHQEDFDKATKLFITLETGEYMRSYQKRHNYLYRDIELALKWSEDWGHHLELEVVVNDISKKEDAEKKIFALAEELGVKIMTNQELLEFTQVAEAEYKKKQQNGNS
jgi:predicted adenylyl cyclase CyaB